MGRKGFWDFLAEEGVRCGFTGKNTGQKSPKKEKNVMKLREKIKRFWTLDVHNHEGFTLVELIIVIAILAILSSVAVVGYSSYVEKANKQADLTLAAEIENALMLAMYSDKLTDGDYVIIYVNGQAVAGNENGATTADEAMTAAFGANWKDALKLKYPNWDMGVAGNTTLMGYVNGSTFDANPEIMEGMLNGVSTATGILAELIDNGSFTFSEEMQKYLDDKGVSTEKGNGMAASNATVLFVASDITATLKANKNEAAFAEAWQNSFSFPSITKPSFSMLNDLAAISAQLAFVEALASYADTAANNGGAYVKILRDAKADGTPSALSAAMNAVISQINAAFAADQVFGEKMLAYYGYKVGVNGLESPADITATRAYQDAMAFLAYMQGIDSSADTLVSNTDLSNPDYYTDGTMLDYVTDYVSVSDVMAALGGVEDAFVFYYNAQTGTIRCVPLDY